MTFQTLTETPAVAGGLIYRCVNGACVRSFPRRVSYCPFCGTSQNTGLPGPGVAPRTQPVSIVKPAAGAPSSIKPAPQVGPTEAAMPRPAPAARATMPPSAAPAVPALPPQRKPVRLRVWLLALGALWLIWVTQRPAPERIEARIDQAIALAKACKSGEAQSELIALQDSTAAPHQLQRLQMALNDADAACDPQRPRRAAAKTPRSVASQQKSQSAQNLIADARLALALGNYKAAADKMEVCAAMVDAGNRECSKLKARAERLQAEMQRCVDRGQEWFSDRCL
jgi:hypothetical protein